MSHRHKVLAQTSQQNGVGHRRSAGFNGQRRELADPKYKGKWTQPPWTSDWDIAPLGFADLDKGKWLEIVRKAGKNAGAVQHALTGVERMLLGEYAFALGRNLSILGINVRPSVIQ